MIPYELIIPSACRPHLLEVTLRTLFENLDQTPVRVFCHDDAAFPERKDQAGEVLAAVVPKGIPWELEAADPPRTHGHALHWLLSKLRATYCLYTQDDFVTLRPLPVSIALAVMHRNGLHQIRFNKRATMEKKGREGQEFYKVEVRYACGDREDLALDHDVGHVLCISDHWYFQTSLWRVDRIRPVVAAWMARDPQQFREHAEAKINHTMNGRLGQPFFGDHWLPSCLPPDLPEHDPGVRDVYLKTYIWGPVGEPAYVRHIGDKPEDWAMYHIRDGMWSGRPESKAKDYAEEGH